MPSALARRWRSFNPSIRAFFMFDLCYQLALTVYGLYFPRYLLALGYAEDTLGSLMAVGTICVAICSIWAGMLSDRIGRRRSLLTGISISKAAFLLRGFVVALPALYGCYIVDGMFMTMYAAAGTPFIFENTRPEERIHAFSLQGIILRASGIVGNTIGGLLPRLVLAAAPNLGEIAVYRVIFVLAVGLAFIGVRQLYRLPADGHAMEPRAQARTSVPFRQRLRLPIQGAELSFIIKYAVTSSLVAFGAGHLLPFMNTYLIRTFAAGPEAVGLVLSAAQFATILGISLAPALGERYGIIRSVLVTRVMALPLVLAMAVSGNIWIAGLAYSMRNMLHQMSGPLTSTFMLSHLSRTTRATANGLLQSFENTVRAVAMFSSGLIITRYGYPRAFQVALVAYTLSALTFYLFFYRRSSLVGERDVTETA